MNMRSARGLDGWVCAGLLALCARAGAHVYVEVDAQGSLHFSDRRDDAAQVLYIEEAVPAAPGAPATALMAAVPADVAAAAHRHGLDAGLLHAIVHAESGFRRDALSPRGAMGLMQLMPGTARELGVADPYEPRANLEAGALHFRRLLDRFRDTRLALAAYNAGAGAVERYGNTVPPYPETIEFVRRVEGYWRGAKAGTSDTQRAP